MRWQGGRQSGNLEDRRGMRMGPMAGGGIGVVILAIVAALFGVDPRVILQGGGETQTQQSAPATPGAPDEMRDFVATILGSTEDVWTDIFRQGGKAYEPPKLVLFSGAAQSACGFAQSAVGPFYCTQDQKVYLDLSFFEDLKRRFNAPGDFAQAYVIAHEVGHHVQNLLGITEQAERAGPQQGASGSSVRMELQADCFAGVWGNRAQVQRNILEPGDVEEALNAAASIGDDRLQKRSSGTVVPESFTHGSSEQRVRWFKRGFESGDMRNCDTFAASTL